jgi:hypothetical protein
MSVYHVDVFGVTIHDIHPISYHMSPVSITSYHMSELRIHFAFPRYFIPHVSASSKLRVHLFFFAESPFDYR